MSYNERIFSILMESKKCCDKKVSKDECGEACETFADTIGNGHNFSDTIIPNGIKMSCEEVPVCKKECGKDCVKEEYFIDGRILDIYMEDNEIENDAEAVMNVCEHYGIDLDDVYVVVESDDQCKDLIDFAKDNTNYLSLGLLKRSTNRIANLVNHGIKVVKK